MRGKGEHAKRRKIGNDISTRQNDAAKRRLLVISIITHVLNERYTKNVGADNYKGKWQKVSSIRH